MKLANIADLKNNLSDYLSEVAKGEEILGSIDQPLIPESDWHRMAQTGS